MSLIVQSAKVNKWAAGSMILAEGIDAQGFFTPLGIFINSGAVI
jgi:hypothetical protein